MKTLLNKYIYFGSKDSIDVDKMYFLNELPSLQDMRELAKEFEDDVNFCVVKDGRVIDTYKGTIDEVNNSLYETYSYHKQDFPNPITGTMIQDIDVKLDRVLLCLLSMISRSKYRHKIKPALKSNTEDKLYCLEEILTDCFVGIRYEDLVNEKYSNSIEFSKLIVFQLGQILSLFENNEVGIFTKKEVCDYFFELDMNVIPYLMRVDVNEYYFQLSKAKCISRVPSINYIINYFIIKCLLYLK